MAHITGGGIAGNLSRVIPEGLSAEIDLSTLRIPPIFKYIKEKGRITDEEMLKTFNCGAGFLLVVEPSAAPEITQSIKDSYPIGTITENKPKVTFHPSLTW
jgi:phosphoribosylformylglycinamidine cyclo-ligase